MAVKQRRLQDILTKNYSNYESVSKEYAQFFNGESPTYITYYAISKTSSVVDTTLQNTHELVGDNSGIKYNRIKNVPVYSMSLPFDIAVSMNPEGLNTAITGSFILLPNNNLFPVHGEFFSMASSNNVLNQNLFIITNVTPDRPTENSLKYYRCDFALYPENTDFIESQVVKKYIYVEGGDGNEEGVGDSTVISEEAYETSTKLQGVIDNIIDKYREMYYDAAMDTFSYQKPINDEGMKFIGYWSPYLLHFIYETDCLRKYNEDFLQEIYYQNYTESLYPRLYSDYGYYRSIFWAVQKKDTSKLDPLLSSFMQVSPIDINKPLSLPFFSQPQKYYMLDVADKYIDRKAFWDFAFHWLLGTEDNQIILEPKEVKFQGLIDNIFDLSDDGCICGIKIDPPKLPALIYQMEDLQKSVTLPEDKNKLKKDKDFKYYKNNTVKNVYYITEDSEIINANIIELLKNYTNFTGDEWLFFRIIQKYFDGTLSDLLSLDTAENGKTNLDNFISEFDTYFYDNNLRNYLLIPMVLYILKQNITTV